MIRRRTGEILYADSYWQRGTEPGDEPGQIFSHCSSVYLYGEADECEPADTSERGSLHPGETKNSVGLNPVPEFIARWAGLGYDEGD